MLLQTGTNRNHSDRLYGSNNNHTNWSPLNLYDRFKGIMSCHVIVSFSMEKVNMMLFSGVILGLSRCVILLSK